jgi:hypothetical protein
MLKKKIIFRFILQSKRLQYFFTKNKSEEDVVIIFKDYIMMAEVCDYKKEDI